MVGVEAHISNIELNNDTMPNAHGLNKLPYIYTTSAEKTTSVCNGNNLDLLSRKDIVPRACVQTR